MRAALKKVAFTLAEVLIVLGIIGIVAELTIPVLLNDFQKKSEVVALKKFYTNFNQMLKLLSTEYGCIDDLACTGIFSGDVSSVGGTIAKYFKVAKDCGATTDDTCFSATQNKGYAGTGASVSINGANSLYKFVTNDGMSIAIQVYTNNCANAWSTSGTGPMSKTCGYVFADINGQKSPNRIGRDIFTFWITTGRGPMLYPDGGLDDKANNVAGRHWSTTCLPANSYQCSAQIIEQGWEMNY